MDSDIPIPTRVASHRSVWPRPPCKQAGPSTQPPPRKSHRIHRISLAAVAKKTGRGFAAWAVGAWVCHRTWSIRNVPPEQGRMHHVPDRFASRGWQIDRLIDRIGAREPSNVEGSTARYAFLTLACLLWLCSPLPTLQGNPKLIHHTSFIRPRPKRKPQT